MTLWPLMAATKADAQRAADQVTARLLADPVLGPLLKQQAAGQPFDSNAADARLKQLGIELPQGMWISGGKVKHENMTVDNIGKALKIALPVVMTAGALGAFGAPSVLSAAGAPAAGGVGIGETGATVGLGGSGFGTAAGVAGATKAGSSLWSRLASPLITSGITAATDLYGTKMQVDANTKAAEIAAKSAEEALNWEKDVYHQRQEQLAPAIGVGNGANRALGNLMGIAEPEGGYHAPAAPGSAPAAPAAPPAPDPAAPPPQTGVQMKSPTGQVSRVPPDQVSHYEQLGAVRV